MWRQRLRFEFRMKLATEKPRVLVACELDVLDKFFVGRNATENQTTLFKRFPVRRIELITMTMSLVNLFRAAVDVASERVLRQPARPGAKSHRSPHFFDVDQIPELENDRIRSVNVEFG